MHQLLRRDQTIRLFPVYSRPVGKAKGKGKAKAKAKVGAKGEFVFYDDYSASMEKRDPMDLKLPASGDHSLDDGTTLHIDHYYRPRDDYFPTVDSIFFIDSPGDGSPILLMFQITCSKVKHGVDLGGLERIEKLLPSGARAYYVVVTPTNIYPRIKILKSYFEDLDALDPERVSEVFTVFHYPVDDKTLYQVEYT